MLLLKGLSQPEARFSAQPCNKGQSHFDSILSMGLGFSALQVFTSNKEAMFLRCWHASEVTWCKYFHPSFWEETAIAVPRLQPLLSGGTGEMSGWTGKRGHNVAAPPVAQGCIAARELAVKIIWRVTNWWKREYFKSR